MARKTLSISRQRLTDNISLAKTDRLKCETTLFKDGSNPMISFDPKFFKAEAVWIKFGDGVSRNVLLKYVIEG